MSQNIVSDAMKRQVSQEVCYTLNTIISSCDCSCSNLIFYRTCYVLLLDLGFRSNFDKVLPICACTLSHVWLFATIDYVKIQIATGEREYLLPYTREIWRVLKIDTCLSYRSDPWTPADICKEFAIKIFLKIFEHLWYSVLPHWSIFTLHISLPSSGKFQCFGAENFRVLRNFRNHLVQPPSFFDCLWNLSKATQLVNDRAGNTNSIIWTVSSQSTF